MSEKMLVVCDHIAQGQQIAVRLDVSATHDVGFCVHCWGTLKGQILEQIIQGGVAQAMKEQPPAGNFWSNRE